MRKSSLRKAKKVAWAGMWLNSRAYVSIHLPIWSPMVSEFAPKTISITAFVFPGRSQIYHPLSEPHKKYINPGENEEGRGKTT